MHALSAHIVVIDPSKSQAILQVINAILEKQFKITHSTIQIERQGIDIRLDWQSSLTLSAWKSI